MSEQKINVFIGIWTKPKKAAQAYIDQASQWNAFIVILLSSFVSTILSKNIGSIVVPFFLLACLFNACLSFFVYPLIFKIIFKCFRLNAPLKIFRKAFAFSNISLIWAAPFAVFNLMNMSESPLWYDVSLTLIVAWSYGLLAIYVSVFFKVKLIKSILVLACPGIAFGASGLLVMRFLMAIYVVPGPSMQPTILGEGDYLHSDRVVVNKWVYHFSDPKRWDIVVFKYPYRIIQCQRCMFDVDRSFVLDDVAMPEDLQCPRCNRPDKLAKVRRDYVKRCVALPGEELMIKDGDIWLKKDGKWKLTLKPDKAQDALWTNDFDYQDKQVPFSQYWLDNAMVSVEENVLTFKHGGYLKYIYQGGIKDHGDRGDGLDRRLSLPEYEVSDVSLDLSLRELVNSGVLSLNIRADHLLYQAKLDFSKKNVSLLLGNKLLISKPIELSKDIAFMKVDGHLIFESGENKIVYSLDLEGYTAKANFVRPSIYFEGESISLTDLALYRDVYYGGGRLFSEQSSLQLGSDEYFMMGDNPKFSSDSREWGPVRRGNVIGKASYYFNASIDYGPIH